MAHQLVCWKCGADLAALTLPLLRLDLCPQCGTDLHVCRMCREYDTSHAQQCREPTAEEVRDKTHANFCDFFAPRPGAFTAADSSAADRARDELSKLFGSS